MKSADARQIDLNSRMVAKSRQKSCKQTQNPFISWKRRPRGMKLAQEILKKRRKRLKTFLWVVLRLDGARPCTRKAWHRCSRDKWSIRTRAGGEAAGANRRNSCQQIRERTSAIWLWTSEMCSAEKERLQRAAESNKLRRSYMRDGIFEALQFSTWTARHLMPWLEHDDHIC